MCTRQICKLFATSLFAFTLLGAAQQARADDVPVLNVNPVCHGIAQQAATPAERGDMDLAFKQCVESEHAARDKLATEWTTFAAADKASCLAEARMAGLPSYTDLLTCLEMARDAKKLNAPGAPSRSIKQ
jgi:hypothetical protein